MGTAGFGPVQAPTEPHEVTFMPGGSVSTNPIPDLLTVSEAADILRVGHETVRRRVRNGSIPACRLGTRSIRIRRADVEKIATPAPEDASTIEAHIARIVAAAPPLSPEQRDRLSMLFRPADGASA